MTNEQLIALATLVLDEELTIAEAEKIIEELFAQPQIYAIL